MFNYTNWDRGEPNNLYNQEKCMESILEGTVYIMSFKLLNHNFAD